MEANGEISDTDSGIILNSGSDSPTTLTKDVTTHTRAMKLRHQDLKDKLEICILELKKLCIREAELTGRLSDDYPLLPGEKPPQIRRRIGAAFKLDDQSIPQGTKDSELSSVDGQLALQTKIFEAARKLCEEERLSKAVKKSRQLQCKREEKKLKRLQELAFQLRLERGRSSPHPALNASQDLGTSDDSSLSDSVVQDEEAISQLSQLSCTEQAHSSSLSFTNGSYLSPSVTPQPLPLTPTSSPIPSINSVTSLVSSPADDLPPIQHSPWTESSLDQPYEKSKKSRSSSKTSTPTKSESLPPLEECLAQAGLPVQLPHVKLSRSHSNSTPSTPEIRVHRQLSLRYQLSSPDSPFERNRGRTRSSRRRLTDCAIALAETPPHSHYGSQAGAEDNHSEHSYSSYSSSPCQELPYQSALLHSSPVGCYGPPAFPHTGFYQTSRYQSSPSFHRGYYNEEMVYPPDLDLARGYYAQQVPCPPSRYEYSAVPRHRGQAALPPNPRLSPSPAKYDSPHHRPSGVSPHVVNEQLKSWHRRSQLKAPRSRSLDRQGAIRFKNTPGPEATYYQNQKYNEQRRAPQAAAEEPPGLWLGDDSHFASQV
uniref:Innate immunity activator b n=1 Tax=Tetraodon nigroviridis TaxID=99883 RepID=H3CNP0_TETNG